MGTAAAYLFWKQCVSAQALFGFSDSKQTHVHVQRPEDVRWEDVRKDIAELLESNSEYDDGSYGPLLVRLAWHQCGTYCQFAKVS